MGRRARHRRPGRRLGRRRGRAAHRRVGHAVGPRLDPERQRHLRRGQARPPRQPAGRAGQGPQRLPGLRRPGRVPDQDQRGPRPARRQGVRRQAELHGRHRALVRRPARRQRRTPADGTPTPRRRASSPSRASRTPPRPRPGRRPRSQEAGATSTTETYNGVTITVIKPPADVSVMAKEVQRAYAVIGPVLAIGDTSSVKAAIDTGGKTGLNTDEQFKTAVGDDHRRPARLRLRRHGGHRDCRRRRWSRPTTAMPTAALSVLDGLYPDWSVVAVEAKDGALVVESRQPHNEKLGTAPNAASTLPSLVPADTVALVDTPRLRRRAEAAQGPARLGCVAQGRRPAGRRRAQAGRRLRRRGRLDGRVGDRDHEHATATVAGGIVIVPTERRRRQPAVHPAARVHRARGRRIRASSSPTRRTTARRSPRSTCPASARSPGPRPGSTFPAGCSSRTP